MSAAPRTRIVLYTQETNPFSHKVIGALALKGLDFERVVSEDPEDIRRWSPVERTLPVLEIDGRRMADSTRIVEWLESRFPSPSLYSADPQTAEAQRKLADWADSTFLWYWQRWQAARPAASRESGPTDPTLLARFRARLGLAPRPRAPLAIDPREQEIGQEMVDRIDDLNGFLGERTYFYADAPSIADLSVFSMLRVLRAGPIAPCRERIEARASLVAYIDRMERQVPVPPPRDRSG